MYLRGEGTGGLRLTHVFKGKGRGKVDTCI